MQHFVTSPLALILIELIILLTSCAKAHVAGQYATLRHDLDSLASESKGTIGIALIMPDGDTLTVNNHIRYPLMSVFKLHEAIAVAAATDRCNQSFDSIINIPRNQLSNDTWSPMLHNYPSNGDISISVGELVKYCLLVSDNNASNILFDHIASVEATDSTIRTLNVDTTFRLAYTERQMQAHHPKSYSNWSAPMACASLIKKLFTDTVVSQAKQDSIISWLGQCTSANTRMAAATAASPGVKLFHRTGSGYTNPRGEIIAVNDIGLLQLPDGREATVAILIKDYAGPQPEADAEIARITGCILSHLLNTPAP